MYFNVQKYDLIFFVINSALTSFSAAIHFRDFEKRNEF